MDIKEARRKCSKLAKLNEKIWELAARTNVKAVREARSKFCTILSELECGGFKVSAGLDERRKPKFTARKSAATGAWRFWDPRPSGVDYEGDCTTRSISFCTGLPYMKVRAEQDEQAKRMQGTMRDWNLNSVWPRLLTDRGWRLITLNRKVKRRVLAESLVSATAEPYLTHSSKHVAAVKDGVVYDTFSSTNGMVDWIIVSATAYEAVRRRLSADGLFKAGGSRFEVE